MTALPGPSARGRADVSLSRRRFLLSGLGGLTVLGLGAWDASAARRASRARAVHRAGIRIDMHSRVFNGQDLHLARFLERVVAPEHPAHADLIRAGASVAQALAWALAPSGAAETWRLDELARARGPMLASGDDSEVLRDRRDADRRFREALAVVLPGTAFFPLYLGRLMSGARAILGRPAAARLGRMARAGALGGADVDFLLSADGPERALLGIRPLEAFRRFTYYRYLGVRELLQPGGLTDLAVPTVAVFDGGPGARATPTSPRDQLTAMARLVTLCGGRLHPLVPFDPCGPAVADDTLALVRDAVERRGFVGVTLTGPVGRAAHPLLEWCAREEVAVVTPRRPDPETEALLARHPGLRLGIRAPSQEILGSAGWSDGLPMHGIDWMRRSIEGNAREIHRLDAGGDTAAVLGDHAAGFLGLRRGGRTRERLERFYDRENIAPPGWMQALDARGVSAPDGGPEAG